MIGGGAATFMFMSLRFYCKHYLGTKLALDDLVLTFSWVRLFPPMQKAIGPLT